MGHSAIILPERNRKLYTTRGIEPIDNYKLRTLNLENEKLTLALEILDNSIQSENFGLERSAIIEGLVNLFNNTVNKNNPNQTLTEIYSIVFNEDNTLIKNASYTRFNDCLSINVEKISFELNKTVKFIIATLLFKVFLHENVEVLTANYSKGDKNLMQNFMKCFREFLKKNIHNPSQNTATGVLDDITISDIIYTIRLFNSRGEYNYLCKKKNGKLLVYYNGNIPGAKKPGGWFSAQPIKEVILAIPLTSDNVHSILPGAATKRSGLKCDNVHSILPGDAIERYELKLFQKPFTSNLSVWYKPWTWNLEYLAVAWQKLTDFCWRSKEDLDNPKHWNGSGNVLQVEQSHPPKTSLESSPSFFKELDKEYLEEIKILMKKSYSEIMNEFTQSEVEKKFKDIEIKTFMDTLGQYINKIHLSDGSESIINILDMMRFKVEQTFENKKEFKDNVVGYLDMLVRAIVFHDNEECLSIYLNNAEAALELLKQKFAMENVQNSLISAPTKLPANPTDGDKSVA